MRQTIRAALKRGRSRVAVVCGAWHAPVLTAPLGPAAAGRPGAAGAGESARSSAPGCRGPTAASPPRAATAPGSPRPAGTPTSSRPATPGAALADGRRRRAARPRPAGVERLGDRGRPAGRDPRRRCAAARWPGWPRSTDATRAVLCDGDERRGCASSPTAWWWASASAGSPRRCRRCRSRPTSRPRRRRLRLKREPTRARARPRPAPRHRPGALAAVPPAAAARARVGGAGDQRRAGDRDVPGDLAAAVAARAGRRRGRGRRCGARPSRRPRPPGSSRSWPARAWCELARHRRALPARRPARGPRPTARRLRRPGGPRRRRRCT